MDCSERDQEFLEKLHRQDHGTLRRRQMARLVGICRQVAGILVAPFDHDRVAAEASPPQEGKIFRNETRA
jgi:hypothetical protein